MTYNEWRDELKQNLLCVTESERRRVLDYYAEAYADRRDAGFTEREIIEDFGAPYDAAQRILTDNCGDSLSDGFNSREQAREARQNQRREQERMREEQRREQERMREDRRREQERMREEQRRQQTNYAPPPPPPPSYNCPPPPPVQVGADYTWLFVLLCIIFAIPLFGLIMTMVGITIGLAVAPFAVVITGAGITIGSFVNMVGGNFAYGCYLLGGGLITLGVGIILCPLFIKLIKLMWKLFTMVFGWIKQIFSGKRSWA